MARYLKTNLDPEGKLLRIEAGLRTSEGKTYLVLFRLPPEYAKPPLFIVELSGDRMEVRGDNEECGVLYKAYAHQAFTPKELQYLAGLKEGGTHAPFFNFSYPTVLKVLGKTFYKLTEAEVSAIVDRACWKLVGGLRP